MDSRLPADVFVTVTPIAIVGAIYYLLVRFRRRGLSRPVHAAFLVTLAILMIWGTYLFVVVTTRGGFSRLIYFDWAKYFLPVTGISLVLVWSIVTLWELRTQSADVAVRVTSRGRVVAVTFIVLAVISFLGYGYREHQLGVASDNSVAPERLRALYHSKYARIGSQVMDKLASNPATPIDVLQQLARHDDKSVRRSVGHNSATPLSVLSVLAKDENLSVRKMVCHNPATPLSVLSVLAEDEHWGIRWCVARNPNASAALLAKLANDQSSAVRRSLAYSTTVPTELLLKMSRDSSENVRTTVALNKDTPVAALVSLSTDSSENVRRLVAVRTDLPLKQRLQLAEDKSAIVRDALMHGGNTPIEVLNKLENDPDEKVRQSVKRRKLERKVAERKRR